MAEEVMKKEETNKEKKESEKQIVKAAVKKAEHPAKKEKHEEKKAQQEISEAAKQVDDPFKTIKFVLMTEKAVQIIEKQNKLVFIVNRSSDKPDIKAAVESAFSSPIMAVQTMIDREGRKKAFVKFRNAGAAGDIAIKLGII